MQNYSQLSDIEKYSILDKMYNIENKSFKEIADIYETYPNKIRRDAKKFGIQIRSKSDAQKLALTTGKHKHPTKGTKRKEETKNKIGNSVMKSWDNLDETELNKRKQKARDNWNKLSEEEKQSRLQEANAGVRISSKLGSKLERFLLESLIENGYKVVPHKEHILSNTKLHIDLFLPKANIAIEVDGPSHFEPVWGEEALKRNQDYDHKKNGLLIGKGINLIRVKQKKDFSKSRAKLIFGRLMEAMADVKNQGKNYIEIGDE
jgi:very-short-patch-repair endonuclease